MIKRLVLFAIPALFLGVSGAHANVYGFSYSGAGVSASGTLTTSPISYGGGYEVIALSGSLISPDLNGSMTLDPEPHTRLGIHFPVRGFSSTMICYFPAFPLLPSTMTVYCFPSTVSK